MTDLSPLIAKVDALSGPDRDVDADVALALGLPQAFFGGLDGVDGPEYFVPSRPQWAGWGKSWEPPAYTASIDAVVALIERRLPGWRLIFEATDGVANDVYLIGPGYRDSRPREWSSPPVGGKPIAIALLLAFLRALQATRTGGDADG